MEVAEGKPRLATAISAGLLAIGTVVALTYHGMTLLRAFGH